MFRNLALCLLSVLLLATSCFAGDVVIFVHGVAPVQSEFDALEKLLTARGHTVRRFEYDWNGRIDKAADQLVDFVERNRAPGEGVTILGYSLGGLVSRRALTEGRKKTLAGADKPPVRLVTAATPFGGIRSANFSILAPFLPWVKPMHLDVGSLFKLIREPGKLGKNVVHVKISTNEVGKTLFHDGTEIPDTTILPREQVNPAVDNDPQLIANPKVEAGHTGLLVNRPDLLATWLTRDLSPERLSQASAQMGRLGQTGCDPR